jgi:hypothetical protein
LEGMGVRFEFFEDRVVIFSPFQTLAVDEFRLCSSFSLLSLDGSRSASSLPGSAPVF